MKVTNSLVHNGYRHHRKHNFHESLKKEKKQKIPKRSNPDLNREPHYQGPGALTDLATRFTENICMVVECSVALSCIYSTKSIHIHL